MKKAKELGANPRNPRKITDEKLELLKKSLAEFGDLSGIVYNTALKRLVGGHQRLKIIPTESDIVIEKTYDKPTAAGTTAEGYVILGTERIRYREVQWTNEKDLAANIAANKHGGDWDISALNDILLDLDHSNYDMGLTGFSESELESLLAPTELSNSSKELDLNSFSGFHHQCPKCGFEWDNKPS